MVEIIKKNWLIPGGKTKKRPSCKCLCSTDAVVSECYKPRDHYDAADQGIELRYDYSSMDSVDQTILI